MVQKSDDLQAALVQLALGKASRGANAVSESVDPQYVKFGPSLDGPGAWRLVALKQILEWPSTGQQIRKSLMVAKLSFDLTTSCQQIRKSLMVAKVSFDLTTSWL
jgi:hypothetical protein